MPRRTTHLVPAKDVDTTPQMAQEAASLPTLESAQKNALSSIIYSDNGVLVQAGQVAN
ncbi:MAG: hypothetical protein H0T73_06395 [Ardenticatenales bacterium]|nr:hypothetical protein [Ardenticatenales bacterium]